ncbi:transmembrane protein 205 [Centropristis striata]|uniref:transmembrane protein 205 n=1 Tax=Centropristis striata TaxID=184440 RepID=UPI0027E1959E|nr:transmembrane protein 205 [Centropristis striata]
MATELETTTDHLVKVLHLLVLSFSWGVQVWVPFIAVVVFRQVPPHTFGLVQGQIFPVYFYCLLGSNTISLTVYVVFHCRELLDWHQRVQMVLYLVAVLMACLNARWLGPAAAELVLQMREVEEEHGLGEQKEQEEQKEQKEAYAKLSEKDPKYRGYRRAFSRYHGLANLCNLLGFICTTANLTYTALHLSSI